MEIVYRKDTLYVYIDEEVTKELVEDLKRRTETIMDTYGIDNLVVDTHKNASSLLSDFAVKYNTCHRSKMILK